MAAPLAPRHPMVVQGPTEPSSLYVWVTWDRNDLRASSYNVYRNSSLIASVSVTGDPWDKCAYKDTGVAGSTNYLYTITALSSAGEQSTRSDGAQIYVRTDADLGPVIEVDVQTGATDRDKILAAISAAKANGGGVVKFGGTPTVPKVYSWASGVDRIRLSSTKNVVLRGGGMGATILRDAGGSATNAADYPLLEVIGGESSLGPLSAAAIAVGDRSVSVSSVGSLAAGQRIMFDQVKSGTGAVLDTTAGAIQDPGTGADNTHAFDINVVESIVGTTVTFKWPFSQQFTAEVAWVRMAEASVGVRNFDNGVELMTIEAPAGNTTYRTLLQVNDTVGFRVAGVRFSEPNRNQIETYDAYGLTVVGCEFPRMGTNAFSGTTKYGINGRDAVHLRVVGCVFGTAGSVLARSHITLNKAQRVVVRHNTFYDSDTYAFNEHGFGSRHWRFENNLVNTPSASHAGVLFGNETFNFSGPGIVRNIKFDSCSYDVRIIENSYEIRFLDIASVNCANALTRLSGWGNDSVTPTQMAAGNYGSLRATFRRWTVTGAARGFVLGESHGISNFPYVGVKDVIIDACSLGTTLEAIDFRGDSTRTNRFQVSGNTGTTNYLKPAFVAGDYWSGNADGVTYGTPTAVAWADESFAWEAFDVQIAVDHPLSASGSSTSSGLAVLEKGPYIPVFSPPFVASLIPSGAGSQLSPVSGTAIRIKLGVRHPDGTVETTEVGVFGLETVSAEESGGGVQLSVSGMDQSIRIERDRFREPYVVKGGTNYVIAIMALVTRSIPGATFRFQATDHTTPDLSWEFGEDPLGAIKEMADSIGYETFFAGDGVFVIRPMAIVPDQPVWDFVEGPGTMVQSLGRGLSREGVYNGVVQRGENRTTGLAPVQAEAWDTDSASPTYYDPLFPSRSTFGAVPLFHVSEFLRTQTQAQDAAYARLRRLRGISEQVNITARPVPGLEGGDVVHIRRKRVNVDAAHVIERITLPLKAGLMSIKTRERRL